MSHGATTVAEGATTVVRREPLGTSLAPDIENAMVMSSGRASSG